MKTRMYLVVSILFFTIAVVAITLPMWQFQHQQKKLAMPTKITPPALPKMEKPIDASQITTPDKEKTVVAAAKLDSSRTIDPSLLQFAEQAAREAAATKVTTDGKIEPAPNLN